MNFRPRLYHIKNEKKLWKYFEENAGYDESLKVYKCAGIGSSDTRDLWLRLVEEWKKDTDDQAKRLLEEK